MRALTLFTLVSAALARQPHTSSGIGRFPLDPLLKYSPEAFSSSIQTVADSVNAGPNRTLSRSLPVEKMYGVNIGNWLLMEPWMSSDKWVAMGGEHCDDCSTCRRSEWSLAKHLGPQKTDDVFQEHWKTWFTDKDIEEIKSLGLNTVRVPLPFWIIEDIVDRENEPYARGGLDELIRGLKSMKNAGLHVILDLHALPGVSTKNSMFAGNCTNDIHFYEDANYVRAATWTAVMTFLTHTHPAFEKVFAIQAINEPEMEYALTPGYDRYQKSFVLTLRAVELALGILCDERILYEPLFDPIAREALAKATPIIFKLALKYGLDMLGLNADANPFIASSGLLNNGGLSDLLLGRKRECISTNFMNRDWQWTRDPVAHPIANPADVARGPQIYDNHLYYFFGGVADPNEEAYLKSMCNLMRIQDSEAIGDTPLFFGEWSIGMNSPNGTTDAFLRKWGDAQKLMYGKTSGWIFWSWKIFTDEVRFNTTLPRMWSYRDAVNNGVFPRVASELFDPHVCDPYIKKPDNQGKS